MKTTSLFLLGAAALLISFQAEAAENSKTSLAEQTVVLDRGPNHRRIRYVSTRTNQVGQVTLRTNNYTELGIGLHYWQDGAWRETQELIESFEDGAAALRGPHKVIFNHNLNTEGAVDFETPTGVRLRSHVLGLGYYDVKSGKSVIFAEVKDSIGQIVGRNQIVYADAFAGVRADVRYTYMKSGIEQDIILRAQPPAPEQYGLNANTTRLQVFTEFLNPPPIEKTSQRVRAGAEELVDEQIRVGGMRMGRGKAFSLDESKLAVPVGKQFLEVDGRSVLVEEITLASAQVDLQKLKRQSAAPTGTNVIPRMAATQQIIPNPKFAQAVKRPMRMAQAQKADAGYVLDYVLLGSGVTDFTFAANTTYLIWGDLSASGPTTIEAGAVIKFDQYTSPTLDVGPLICKSTLYNPAIFTSQNDDEAGEIVEDSSGDPTSDSNGFTGLYVESGTTVSGMFFKYATRAIRMNWWGDIVTIENCRFYACENSVEYGMGGVSLKNILINGNSGTALIGSGTTNYITAENLTIDGGGAWSAYGYHPAIVNLTNSIIRATVPASSTWPIWNTNALVINPAGTIFESFNGNDHYLPAASPYRDAGTKTGDQAGLYYYTTQTNQTPEGVSMVDLGFHYPAVDTSGNPIDANGNSVPDYLEDQNANGLMDAWEINHFGNLDQFASGDYDGDGISNLQEYLNGTNPNDFSFSLSVTNHRVRFVNAPVQINVQGGVPASYAVLIDSTDFSAATWNAYVSSNITVPLGGTEGWHHVSVGLKGFSVGAEAVWQQKQLKLDLSAPAIVVTNPTVLLVSQPWIQIQGFSLEPLREIYYDITNAAGLWTNQPALVLDQHYDTNTWEFTTNYFQAFDVGLTNGENLITLHATDLAGNSTSTNITITLDYSTDTNSPAIQLYWPQNEAVVSGSNFTLRGWIDEWASEITVQIANEANETNTLAGLVERNGLIWVEAIPLASGTNWLELTIIDAAGNSSVTNIVITKAAASLQIDDIVDAAQLHQPAVNVTGSFSGSDHAVWVNGIKATLNGDGTWLAENVSVNSGGTAVIQARAIPNSDNNGNGTGGGGGTSMANSGNPSSSAAKDSELQKDKPMRLYVETDTQTNAFTDFTYFYDYGNVWITWDTTHDYTHAWQDGKGGNSSQILTEHLQDWSGEDTNIICSLQTAWPAQGPGTQNPCDCLTDDDDPMPFFVAVDSTNGPIIGMEYCRVSDPVDYVGDFYPAYYTETTQTYTRDAQTKMKLFTGGKATVMQQQSVFAVAGSAREVGRKRSTPPYSEYSYGGTPAIPAQDITIGDLGQLYPDGRLYAALPDNITKDVTPLVVSKDFYTFEVDATKHKLVHLTQCTALSNTNNTRTAVGVGEYVNFTFEPSFDMTAPEIQHWGTTAGSVEPTTGPGTLFTAPSNAATATVSVHVRDVTLDTTLTVLEPSGIDHADITDTNLTGAGFVGAMVELKVYFTPTDVSFGRVEIMEIGMPASAITGYFTNFTAAQLNHTNFGSGTWVKLQCDNSLKDAAGFGPVSPAPPVWANSGLTWECPARWRIDGGPTNTLSGWMQTISIDASQTTRVDKFGRWLSRSVTGQIETD